MKYLIKYISQVDGALSAAEFLHKFQYEGFTDLFVLPEGKNCMLGDNDEITPFPEPEVYRVFCARAGSSVSCRPRRNRKNATPYKLNAA